MGFKVIISPPVIEDLKNIVFYNGDDTVPTPRWSQTPMARCRKTRRSKLGSQTDSDAIRFRPVQSWHSVNRMIYSFRRRPGRGPAADAQALESYERQAAEGRIIPLPPASLETPARLGRKIG